MHCKHVRLFPQPEKEKYSQETSYTTPGSVIFLTSDSGPRPHENQPLSRLLRQSLCPILKPTMGNYERFFSMRKEKAMQFSVYYHSQEQGEYLRQVVAAAGSGRVKHYQELSGLKGENETDVVLVEYQDNNPRLDTWIAQTTRTPGSPEIFLFVEEVSPRVIWKALKLGARELFSRSIPAEDFQAALRRVELRQARLWQLHPEAAAWSGLAGWGQGWGSCCSF